LNKKFNREHGCYNTGRCGKSFESKVISLRIIVIRPNQQILVDPLPSSGADGRNNLEPHAYQKSLQLSLTDQTSEHCGSNIGLSDIHALL